MTLFTGFEGEKFQFDGIPNKFFNLLTDENIQVNAYFNSYKRMDLVGIKVGNSKIQWTAQDGKAEVNGKKLHHRAYITVDNQDYHSYIEIKSVLDPSIANLLFLDVGKYHFRITRIKNCSVTLPYFFNFKPIIYDRKVRPHGIVGQTADFNGAPRINAGLQGEGIIEGNLLDYMVRDLWDSDFKYNKFKDNNGRFLCKA